MHYTPKEVYEYVAQQTKDPIVEWKTCEVSGAQFPIYQSDLEFYDRISPVINGVKYSIPTPRLCPEERARRRLMFRNEGNLYRRRCNASGRIIISVFSPEKEGKVYDQSIRLGDAWDAMNYGREFNFSLSFTEQMRNLFLDVPKRSRSTLDNNVNSEFVNWLGYSKDCYLSSTGSKNDNCYYCTIVNSSEYACDCLEIEECSHCYECVSTDKSFKVFFSFNCLNCNNCYYCEDCENCQYCIGCTNLRNKEYCIFNKAVKKEEFDVFLSHVLKNPKLMEDKIKVHQSEKIMNASKILHSENVIGDAILECSNSLGFNIHNVEHAKFVERVYMCKSMMDCYACSRTENVYEGMSVSIGSYNVLFSTVCHISNEHLLYCDNCSNCQYCFGCIGLKNKQYCILNKQYSKEEYENLVPKIIEYMKQTGERGEFFDPSLSPFGYNETVGNERFPLTREEALARGYKRQDNHFDPIILEGVEVLKGDKIPNDIDSVSDDVLKKIFACEDSGRVFRITKQELEFYRKHNLPLPRKHPNIRHSIRIKKRPLRGLYLRNCDKCKKEMISIFSQDYSGTVYCSSCYSQEFYS